MKNVRFCKISEKKSSLVTTPEPPKSKLLAVQNVPVIEKAPNLGVHYFFEYFRQRLKKRNRTVVPILILTATILALVDGITLAILNDLGTVPDLSDLVDWLDCVYGAIVFKRMLEMLFDPEEF